ncbi:hypothetical protein B566_EDAN019022 [Ephemera danica]|nr:hypothetical protein B566_EDAN019022 [Ephemera danica]
MLAELNTAHREAVATHNEDHRALRFLTCGSVDDGKSTLIGRLLFDSRAILADQIESLEKRAAGRPVAEGGPAFDLSLLTDGLEAEREQGITIDVAYRYFATPKRKFIIADAPGHEQYTRNMVTAAAGSDAAVVLVDITKIDWRAPRLQLLPQTRRHTLLAHLLRVPSIVFAVNKLDAQIEPFGAVHHYGQEVSLVQRREDGRFNLETSQGLRFITKTIFIAAGVGSFQPRTLKVDGLEKFPAQFKGKNIVIVGGGDSALDWALNFAQVGPNQAESVILLHRRDGFRGAPASAAKMKAMCDALEMQFIVGQVTEFEEANGQLKAIKVTAANGLRPTNVPERSLKLQGAYNVAALPGLALLAYMTHEGQRMVLPTNSVATPGWTRWDFGARYSALLAGRETTWRLGVDNAANRRAWKEAPYQFGHAYLYPLPARQWHANVQIRL